MMTNPSLHFIYWLCINAIKKLGFLGIAGLIITIISGLVFFLKTLPMQEQVKITELAINDASLQNQELKKNDQLPVKNTVDKLANFYGSFSTVNSLPQYLKLISQAASKQKLPLNQGDYKFSQTKLITVQVGENQQKEFSRYEMVLPITGEYTQIRKFIAQILFENPSLALRSVHITRESITSKTVEARLEMVIFLKGKAW